MSRKQRVIVEIAVPPLLAAMLLVVTSQRSHRVLDILVGFPALVALAYALAFAPCVGYAAAMEFWFEKGMQERCGWTGTAGLSSVLGLAIGNLIGWLVQGGQGAFSLIGALDGVIVGLYLAHQYRRLS